MALTKYVNVYKCRLCGEMYTPSGTNSEIAARKGTLNGIMRASGLDMHCCKDGGYGVAEFQGTRKAGQTWQELSSVSSNAATADSSLSPTYD